MANPVIEDLRFMTRAADRLRLAGLDLLAELTTVRSGVLAAEQDRLTDRGEADRAAELQEKAEASQHLDASIHNEILRYEAAIALAEVDFSVRAVVHGTLDKASGETAGPGFIVQAHDHYQGFQLGSAVSDERGHFYIDFVPGQPDGNNQTATTKEVTGEGTTTEGATTEGEVDATASSSVDLTVLDATGKVLVPPTSLYSFYPGYCREKRLIVPVP